MLDVSSLIRALVAQQSDHLGALRCLRNALPEFADDINGMIVDELPCAMIGAQAGPKRHYGRFDRDGIDAQAEHEGIALDTLDDITPIRPRNGRSTGVMDYQRVARQEAIADGKQYKAMRYPYSRSAALASWLKILAYFNASPEDRRAGIATLPNYRPKWDRNESFERDAIRAENKLRRQLIRALGALSRAGFPGASERLHVLQPTTGRMRCRR